MSQSPSDLKAELQKGLSMLQTLRDEVRVKLHLAGLEAKEGWKKLEPHLESIEKATHDASEASRTAVTEAIQKVKAFKDSLR